MFDYLIAYSIRGKYYKIYKKLPYFVRTRTRSIELSHRNMFNNYYRGHRDTLNDNYRAMFAKAIARNAVKKIKRYYTLNSIPY